MPSNHKVYQKNTAVKEKTALTKIFFWPLCAISLFISRLTPVSGPLQKSSSGTDALIFKASVFLFCSLHARFFLFKSLLRIGQPRSGTRAQQRDSRQVRGLTFLAPCSPYNESRSKWLAGSHWERDFPRDSI